MPGGLEQKQRWALQCFYPGLIEKLEQLGAGHFEPQPPTHRPRGQGIGGIEIRVRYFLDDGMYLELYVTLKLDASQPPIDPSVTAGVELKHWKPTYYALGYQKVLGDRVFAADFDRHGYHVHMPPKIKLHVPVDETKPNTTNIDLRDFVDLIAKYRRDGTYPVTRIVRK